MTLNSWVGSDELVGGNTEDDVIRRGFKFSAPENGHTFSVGSIRNSSNLSNDNSIRKILFCKVGVGRAYSSSLEHAVKEQVPVGYDSFYLTDLSDNSEKDKSNNEAYKHAYYLRNPAQILPQYLIHYDYNVSREHKSREKAVCDNCESEPATSYCSADLANLCKKCDLQLHSSKLTSRHVRTPIGKV